MEKLMHVTFVYDKASKILVGKALKKLSSNAGALFYSLDLRNSGRRADNILRRL